MGDVRIFTGKPNIMRPDCYEWVIENDVWYVEMLVHQKAIAKGVRAALGIGEVIVDTGYWLAGG